MGGKDKSTNESSGQTMEKSLSDQPPKSAKKSCSKKKPKLKVKVVQKGKSSRVFVGAKVEISGAQSANKKTKKSGIADFGKRAVGEYHVKATALSTDDAKAFTVMETPVDVTLAAGDDKTETVLVEPLNIVTPKIEMEYKVVLLDRKLSQHQAEDETKIYADPTYVEVSLTQTNKNDHPFEKGGKLNCPNADVFLDEECKTKLDVDLTNEQLTGGEKLKLYLRGKTAGKFDLTLELDDPADGFIKLDKNPAKEEMGVVELKMKLHQHDAGALAGVKVDPDTDPIATYHTNLKDKALPEQKAMTDTEKVETGRLLHEQVDGNHGRAKLVCEKLDEGQWPDGTDDYKILIQETKTSGALELYDAEFDGNAKAFTDEIKVSALKDADKTLWVQGKSTTEKLRDVRLELALDRDAGGLAKKVKRNADWCRFTVVKIKEVKIDYTPEVNKAVAWDEAQQRFYINLKADPTGRKVTIGAELTEKLKDVTIHFLLAPDENNRKAANWGKDLPGTWQWKDISKDVKHSDKSDRKDLLHLSAKTNTDGYAKKELVLSRFGGDKFQPAAYTAEDPHLAKYVHGHVDLKKRKPVFADKTITVWRKFWYEEHKVEGIVVAGFGDAADTYEDVKVVMTAAPVKQMARVTANGISPKVIYKKFMLSYYVNDARTAYVNNFPGDESDGLAVGDATRGKFFSPTPAPVPPTDKPVLIKMLNAHGLWVADGLTASQNVPREPLTSFPIRLVANKKLLDPPLQAGNLLKSGRFKTYRLVDGTWEVVQDAALAAGDVYLDPNRNDPRQFRVRQPASLTTGVATHFRLTGIVLRGATSYLGTSYADGIVNSYTPNDEQDFINTINHELGHSFKQVTKVRPAGVPAHPHQYDKDGSHCNYTNKSCLMYESGPQPTSLNRYCPVCHPYVLVQDMSEV